MATLNQQLKEQSTMQPEALLQVVLTSSKTASQLQAAGLGGKVEPIPGLDGIFKGAFTGRQVLALAQHPDIDSIEADEEVKTLNGE
ncbi:MAG: hypothetical protein H7Z21_00725 [Hymenobacter sp.]|nr:hypothetical protein [Hymenobacter sp.]